jgi:glucose uptake protein GlcU
VERTVLCAASALFGTALVATPAAAQSAPTRSGLDPSIQAAIAFVSTLLVGAILVSNQERYTSRVGSTIREEPIVAFLYGIGVLVGFVVLVFLFALMGIVGLLLLLPVALGFVVVSIAGNAIAYITVLSPYVGRLPALALAVAVAAVFGYLPAVGGGVALAGRAVSFALGCSDVGGMTIVYRA